MAGANVEAEETTASLKENGGNGKLTKCFTICAIILLLLATGVALYFMLAPADVQPVIVNAPLERTVPCPRTPKLTGDYTQDTCEKQPNCEWKLFNMSLGIPFNCTYKTDSKSSQWHLQLIKNTEYGANYSLSKSSSTGDLDLVVEIYCRTNNQLRLQIRDKDNRRYQVPQQALPIMESKVKCSLAVYSFEIQSEPFATFHVVRHNVRLLSIPLDDGFVFKDQFIQMTARLNSSTNYGFGEHNHRDLKLNMNYSTWSMFTRDIGVVDAWNLYGVQPYFMNVNPKHKSVIGTLLLNSNAMDVHLQPDPYPSVTYRVIGGIIDMFFFIDDNPDAVTQHYTSLIGRPLLPPYWSLGFQLSRWGYQNTQHVRDVVERNMEAGIPFDVVYGDIDYMKEKFDFTYDNKTFAGLPDLVTEMKANHTRYIIILDPGIGIEENKTKSFDGGNYHALEEGSKTDVFIKEANGNRLVGKVWPGEVYFPDFTNPATVTWWKEQIWDFYNNSRNVSDSGLHFDALWVDMNEPANFRDGDDAKAVCNMNNKYNSPPYIPENLFGNSLVDKTICMDSVQEWGRHYDVHSLYGHSMAMASNKALKDLFPATRPFVLTRSTFTGTNKHAVHWLGDNHSKWEHASWSIVGMLEFSMFGFSMTGADICGFWFNSTESLCQRWMQVGAFYPFARNHNGGFDDGRGYLHRDQDPASFGADMVVSSREVLLTRYKLLPYLYTLLYQAHTRGSTVARPLFFEFMDDSVTHSIDTQFLWGPALLISPCLEEDATYTDVYIPEGKWYDYYSGEQVESRKWHEIFTPMNRINLHVRGGHVIPWQHPKVSNPHVNTHYSKENPFGLLVVLDEEEKASGDLYIDDGESADPISSGNYSLVRTTATSNKVEISLIKDGFRNAPNKHIKTVDIFGVKREVADLDIDDGRITSFDFTQSTYVLSITIKDSSFTYLNNHTIRWSSL